jgi:transmembrane sensor
MKRKQRTAKEEQRLEELLGRYFDKAAREGAPDSGAFDGEKVYDTVQRNITRRNQRRNLVWAAAGTMAVLCTLAALLWRPAAQPVLAMRQTQTGAGQVEQVKLEDGSIVWLNAGSRLTYPEHFGQDKRQIQIEGEAYVEVIADSKRPFEVITGNVCTKVLGTAFNITAYPEHRRTEVTVISGKVSLQAVSGNTQPGTIVGPEQQAVYASDGQRIAFYEHVAVETSLQWKERKLVFNGKKLSQVVAAVERWYGIKIQLGSALSDCTISADFTGEPAEQVLQVLAQLANGAVQRQDSV